MAAESSVEYRTLLLLTDDLELAVKDHLVEIGSKLVASELITPAQSRETRNAHNPVNVRAADLVGYLQVKVQQNSQHYHTFTDVLKKDLAQYGDILKKLKAKYDSLSMGGGGSQPPASVHEPRQSLNGALAAQATRGTTGMLLIQ